MEGQDQDMAVRTRPTDLPEEETFNINRATFTTYDFKEKFELSVKSSNKYKKYLRSLRINPQVFVNYLRRLFPILKWLPGYKLKDYAVNDIIAGLTLGVFCVPQSMAFSLNANLEPVYGLYVALFPVLIYILMGTSHHLSIGTFAIISIMAANAVEQALADVDFLALSLESGSSADELRQEEWLKAHTALCLLVGIIQLIMGILRLGFITMYLSTPILRGFTTGAACHILTTQFKYFFGLEVTGKQGPLSIMYVYIEIFSRLGDCNLAAVTVTIVSLLALVAAKEFMDLYNEKIKIPLPIELLVVTASIMVTYYFELNQKYGLPIIGDIPTGIPRPTLPPMDYFSDLLVNAIVIAVVSYVLNISQAMIIGRKNNYRVNANQEFIAYGCGNVFSSFFSCFTSCSALGRTLLLENTGGKTQIASMVQCLFLVVVLLTLGPLFESLPKCVLGCIIAVALTGMFRQFADIKIHWKNKNWCDLTIWLATWSSVTFVRVDIGLIVGVASAVMFVVIRTQKPECGMLGEINNTSLYRDVGLYDKCKPIPGFKIFQMRASLYYANAEYFKDKLIQMTELNPDTMPHVVEKQTDNIYKNHGATNTKSNNSENTIHQSDSNVDNLDAVSLGMGLMEARTHTLVIDCGYFTFLDSVGVSTLTDVTNIYSKIGVTVVLADCKETAFKILESHGFFKDRRPDCCYPSIHDAILIRKKQHATEMMKNHNNHFSDDMDQEADNVFPCSEQE